MILVKNGKKRIQIYIILIYFIFIYQYLITPTKSDSIVSSFIALS